jgi:putrescine aminotransferase
LACVAGLAAINTLLDEKLAQRAAATGTLFLAALQKLAQSFPDVVKEVRGKGLMIGVELTKEGIGGLVMSELIAEGVLVAYTLNNPKVMRIEPPLAISDDLVDRVVGAFTRAVEKAHDMIEDL